MRTALGNINDSKFEAKFQEAVIFFIVRNLSTKKDMIELQRAFTTLDTDNDGLITREDL